MTAGRLPDLPFPPLGNPGAWSLASAPVGGDPAFAALVAAVEHVPDGTCSEVVAAFDPWLAAAARAANDQRFHLELTSMHAEGLPPVIGGLSAISSSDFVGVPAIAAGRGTAKLVVLVGLGGGGSCAVSAAGMNRHLDLAEGVLVVAPAYAVLELRAGDDRDLRLLCCSVAGPALR